MKIPGIVKVILNALIVACMAVSLVVHFVILPGQIMLLEDAMADLKLVVLASWLARMGLVVTVSLRACIWLYEKYWGVLAEGGS